MAAVNRKYRDLANSQMPTDELLKRSGDLEPADLDLYGNLPDARPLSQSRPDRQASAAVAESREGSKAAHRKTCVSIKYFIDKSFPRRQEEEASRSLQGQ